MAEAALLIVMSAFAVFTVWTAAMLVRNARVARYRKRVVDLIYCQTLAELHAVPLDAPGFYALLAAADRRTSERWDAYDRVTYDEMLNKFWRPLDSFMPPELRPVKEIPHG